MPEMQELMNDGRVHLVQGPMCHWRLSSTGDGDEQGFVRGKRDGRRAAQGWQLCWPENMLEKIVEYG